MKVNRRITNSTWASDLDGTVLWFPVRKNGDDGSEMIVLGMGSGRKPRSAERGQAAATNPVMGRG